jgi:hypothetical protein
VVGRSLALVGGSVATSVRIAGVAIAVEPNTRVSS